MATSIKTAAGFYGTDTDTCYVTPAGRVWLVQSEDDLPAVRELSGLPAGSTSADQLVTPEEAAEWCRQVQDASGEVLLEGE